MTNMLQAIVVEYLGNETRYSHS